MRARDIRRYVLVMLMGALVTIVLLAFMSGAAKANFPFHSHAGQPNGKVVDPVNTLFGGSRVRQYSLQVQNWFRDYTYDNARGLDYHALSNAFAQWTYLTNRYNANPIWLETDRAVGTGPYYGAGFDRWHERLWTGDRNNGSSMYSAEDYAYGTAHWDNWFTCAGSHIPTRPHERAEYVMAYNYWYDVPYVLVFAHDTARNAPGAYYGRYACGDPYFWWNDGLFSLIY